jgi:hypothetical protein
MPKQALLAAEQQFLRIYGTRQLHATLGITRNGKIDYLDTLRRSHSETILKTADSSLLLYTYIEIPIFKHAFESSIVFSGDAHELKTPNILLAHQDKSDAVILTLPQFQTTWQDFQHRYLEQRAVHLTQIAYSCLASTQQHTTPCQATKLVRIDDDVYVYTGKQEHVTILCDSDTKQHSEKLEMFQLLVLPRNCRLQSENFKIAHFYGHLGDPSEANLLFQIRQTHALFYTIDLTINKSTVPYKLFQMASGLQQEQTLTHSDFNSQNHLLHNMVDRLTHRRKLNIDRSDWHHQQNIPLYAALGIVACIVLVILVFCIILSRHD